MFNLILIKTGKVNLKLMEKFKSFKMNSTSTIDDIITYMAIS